MVYCPQTVTWLSADNFVDRESKLTWYAIYNASQQTNKHVERRMLAAQADRL